MKCRFLILTMVFTLSLFATSALADDDWEFGLLPYLWFAGLDGQVSSVPGEPPADVDASFSDILDYLVLKRHYDETVGPGGPLIGTLNVSVKSTSTSSVTFEVCNVGTAPIGFGSATVNWIAMGP